MGIREFRGISWGLEAVRLLLPFDAERDQRLLERMVQALWSSSPRASDSVGLSELSLVDEIVRFEREDGLGLVEG
jgi:hypothetical protein